MTELVYVLFVVIWAMIKYTVLLLAYIALAVITGVTWLVQTVSDYRAVRRKHP